MPTFKYAAKTVDARSITGKMVADSQSAVIEELRKRKLTIISINEIKESSFKISFQSKKVKQEDLVIFSRQLATMIEAGIPILQSLEALQEQMTQPYFKTVITTIPD